ncbi:Disease resistance family protein [Rhynchospora pubera]|uniref:Disease resistance family protein n=1 Tax=Rhynchospora pubera TaxID=906938 RepID=A0AAV8C4W8_9POAL|nr:Disease resistance family protein [Rhynchospora pubera]
MTESVVKFVVEKLGNLIVKEAQLLGGVGDQVKWAQTELMNIQCYLRDADSKGRKGDARAKNWLNQLRDVAYRIEISIDTFFVELEDNRKKYASILDKLKFAGRKYMKVPALRKLAKEFDSIRKDLEGICKSRIDYGIEHLHDTVRGEAVILPIRRTTNQDVDETDVVGLDTDKNNILELLLNPKAHRRAVITIVGPGGVGKTTLAQMVYKRTKAHFDFDIILPVSQHFSLIDLLRRMLNKLDSSIPSNKDVDYYVAKLKSLLSSMRYLIILDDVWGGDLWIQLKEALPDNNNKSRVLMTSRFIDVAKSADPKMTPYALNFLNDNDSRNLLLKKAQPDEESLSNLNDLPDALSKRCKGLPLALIVLGGILSTKEQTYHAWKRVLDTMDWHEEGLDCMKVLAMSYEDMPYYLKPCFLYLALFPEAYKISANHVIKMWIAEGFIPQHWRKTVEEIAEDFVEQLFQRCMIQVSNRSPDGLIKCFRVHDLLRDLAIHEAEEENFVEIFPKSQSINHSHRVSYRASIHSDSLTQHMQDVGIKIRSLLLFKIKKGSTLDGSYLSRFYEFRLLRVLEIVGVSVHVRSQIQLRGFDRLSHLKYLGFKNCHDLIINLTCSVGYLKNLETLDLRGVEIIDSPTDLWTNGTLRHVLYKPRWWDSNELYFPAWHDFRNLQTIKWVSDSDVRTPTNQLPILNSIRKLGLSNCTNWGSVSHRLESLPSLISLGIKGTNIPMEIAYPRVLPNYQNLQTLHLEGTWSENITIEACLFPPHLVKLTLVGLKLEQVSMEELGKLMSLTKLRVEDDMNFRGRMTCSTGFPVLQTLLLNINYLKGLNIEKGVMPKLTYLTTSYHTKLEMPPELKRIVTVDYYH